MIEHSIIEVACERKAFSLRNLINNKGHQSGVYCELSSPLQISVDDFAFTPMRSVTASS